MKKVAILGSTGSIGTQALDVIRANRDRFKVTSLTCGKNIEELSKQIEEFSPRLVVTADETDALILAKRYPKLEVMYEMCIRDRTREMMSIFKRGVM